jgi:hypothetical protein
MFSLFSICCNHFYISGLWNFLCQKSGLIWQDKRSYFFPTFSMCEMILIWRGRYSSRADDIHPIETIFIQERRKSSMMVDFCICNQPLEMIFNHWGSDSTTKDHNQPLGIIIDRHRWYIVCSIWIYHLPQLNLSKNSSRSQLSAKEDNKNPFLR